MRSSQGRVFSKKRRKSRRDSSKRVDAIFVGDPDFLREDFSVFCCSSKDLKSFFLDVRQNKNEMTSIHQSELP